jgi:hypothetical protein
MAEEKKWAPTREQELALTKVGTTPLIDALLKVAMWAEHAMGDSELVCEGEAFYKVETKDGEQLTEALDTLAELVAPMQETHPLDLRHDHTLAEELIKVARWREERSQHLTKRLHGYIERLLTQGFADDAYGPTMGTRLVSVDTLEDLQQMLAVHKAYA